MKASIGSSKSLLSSPQSMFAMMGHPSNPETEPQPVKSAHVTRADNGGYLVEHHPQMGPTQTHTFKNLKGVGGHLAELLEPKEEEKGETAAEEKTEE